MERSRFFNISILLKKRQICMNSKKCLDIAKAAALTQYMNA